MNVQHILVSTILLIYHMHHVYGYGLGAPAWICGPASMEPDHGLAIQTTDIPYTLTSTTSTYTSGVSHTLTLSGESGAVFRGFLIQGEAGDGTVVGTMVAVAGTKTLTCGSVGGEGITHSAKNDKSTIAFNWIGPDVSNGPITFKVTVVKDYSTYWVKKDLLTLTPPDSPVASPLTTTTVSPQTTKLTPVTTQPTIQTPRTTRPIPVPVAPVTVAPVTTKVNTASPPTPQKTTRTQTSSSPPPETDTQEVDTIKEPKTVFIKKNGEIPYDLACGSTKGCFVKCTGNNCEFLVTWEDRGNTVRFEVYGKPDPSLASSWVAVGFSTDTKMGGDSVTECVFNNGRVTAINSYNQGFANFPIGQVGLSNIYGTYTFGVLYCSFERLKATSNNPQQFFNLENDYNIMFAKGRATEFANIRIIKHTQLPQVSANRVDYQSFAVIGSGAKFPLVKAHGCLMVIAWVMFTGIGIVAARYYKSVWADKTFMKLKIWFQIHRACMVLAVLINSIAFILIFVEVGRYSQIADIPGKSYLKSHPVLGIIVTILSLTNPIMAIFRCGGEDAKRAIFNWAHWAVGMSAYILSAICICFGFQLQKSQTPDYAVYIMIVYVLYIILFDIVFEVYECMDRKQKTSKVDSVEMTNTNGTTDNGVSNGNLQTKKKMRKNDRIKTMLLAFHIAFTGAFALILVLVIALN